MTQQIVIGLMFFAIGAELMIRTLRRRRREQAEQSFRKLERAVNSWPERTPIVFGRDVLSVEQVDESYLTWTAGRK